jgi:hypothetical protein
VLHVALTYFVRRRVAVPRSGGGFPQVSNSPPI